MLPVVLLLLSIFDYGPDSPVQFHNDRRTGCPSQYLRYAVIQRCYVASLSVSWPIVRRSVALLTSPWLSSYRIHMNSVNAASGVSGCDAAMYRLDPMNGKSPVLSWKGGYHADMPCLSAVTDALICNRNMPELCQEGDLSGKVRQSHSATRVEN